MRVLWLNALWQRRAGGTWENIRADLRRRRHRWTAVEEAAVPLSLDSVGHTVSPAEIPTPNGESGEVVPRVLGLLMSRPLLARLGCPSLVVLRMREL